VILFHLVAYWYQTLWQAQKISREKIFREKVNRQKITQQHVQIFEAIKDRDSDQAKKAISIHIEFVEKELRKVISEQDEH
jgi:DNA-binding FadR family transcriptional regulator